VNADDVLVRDLPGEEQLLFEALLGLRRDLAALRVGANDLQRNGDLQFRVPRLVHRAHAADTEHFDDVIPRAERLADLERSAGRRPFRSYRLADRDAGAHRPDRPVGIECRVAGT
jgi:hypothetical protein